MRATLIFLGLVALLGGPAQAGTAADAEAALSRDDFVTALALYSRAVTEAGADPAARASALFDRAEIYVRHAEDDKALADYGEALRLTPSMTFKALVLTGRADLFVQDRRYPEAIADYTQALTIKPDMVGVLTARGQAYQRMKDNPAALADFEAELKINANFPRALRGRAAVLGLPDPTQVKEHPW